MPSSSDMLETLLIVLGGYLGVGVLVGGAFMLVGANTLDPAARRSGLAFRLVTLPGAIGLWPVVAARWARRGGAASGPVQPLSAEPSLRETVALRRLHLLAWLLAGPLAVTIVVVAVLTRGPAS